jgi:hypothetical protein
MSSGGTSGMGAGAIADIAASAAVGLLDRAVCLKKTPRQLQFHETGRFSDWLMIDLHQTSMHVHAKTLSTTLGSAKHACAHLNSLHTAYERTRSAQAYQNTTHVRTHPQNQFFPER